MSYRFDTPLIPGAFHFGNRGLGVLGSDVPLDGDEGAGFLYNDVIDNSLQAVEVRGEILTQPATGVLFAFEDSSFSWAGGTVPDSFTYKLWAAGVDSGSTTVQLGIFEFLATQELPAPEQTAAANDSTSLTSTQQLTALGHSAAAQAVVALSAAQQLALFGSSALVENNGSVNHVLALQEFQAFEHSSSAQTIAAALYAAGLTRFGQVATVLRVKSVSGVISLPSFDTAAEAAHVYDLSINPRFIVRSRKRRFTVTHEDT